MGNKLHFHRHSAVNQKHKKKKTTQKIIPLYMHGSLILAHDNSGQNSTTGCSRRSTNLSPLKKNYPYLLLKALPLHQY